MGLMTGDFVPAFDRQDVLEKTRRLKMARSSHRYVRGATEQFYSWLTDRKHADIPQGPPIWICGDCHIGNLGPLAHANGRVEVQIRDLDQTVIGNPAYDLLRLSLSLASSARSSNLRGVSVALMLESVIDGYEAAFQPGFDVEADLEAPASILNCVERADSANWRTLSEDRIDGPTPSIPLGKRFWALTDDERREIERVCATGEIKSLATMLKSRRDDARVKLMDAAYWVKGCSSLGKARYAAILSVEGKNKRRYCLMDFKEAGQAAAPSAPGADMPSDPALRVVEGAKCLSPHLGKRMAATRIGDRSVFVRELLPQDLKLELDLLRPAEASDVAHYVGAIVGKAHSRQMDASVRNAWLRDLKRQSTRTLDAPTWLWVSVVELLAAHERAYLNHCRRHALFDARSGGAA